MTEAGGARDRDGGPTSARRGEARYRRILLKLSGEALLGERQYGVDPSFCAFIAQPTGRFARPSQAVRRVVARRASLRRRAA